jgi:RNA polymerase sigma-70 factor (ECF subfamily)
MSELSAPLSRAEIESALRGLTAGEQTALMKAAQHWAKLRRIPFDPDDLIQETICRVLDGRRPWPRDRRAIEFLTGVIKSIAWEWKGLHDEEIELGDEGAGERGVLAKIDLERIIALFDDDPIAQKMLVGMADGTRGEDIARAVGLSPTEYESKRKKIRRRIEKFIEKLKT